jgi:hypothetical protein
MCPFFLYGSIWQLFLEWVSEWLLFNAKLGYISATYHGENMLNCQWDDDEVRFVLDQHA